MPYWDSCCALSILRFIMFQELCWGPFRLHISYHVSDVLVNAKLILMAIFKLFNGHCNTVLYWVCMARFS